MDFKQFNKLVKQLTDANIPFLVRPLFDGHQVCVVDVKFNTICDVICHPYSWGYKDGLLEYMGPNKEGDEDPIGYLDYQKAFEHCQYAYKKYKNKDGHKSKKVRN